MTAPLLLPLSSAALQDPALAGGKASRLCMALRQGLPVPQGFCVTTAAYGQFLEAAGGAAALQALDQAQAVRERLAQIAVPAAVVTALKKALEQNEEQLWALRSSATAEDLPQASFAGQHDSFLDVSGPRSIAARVKDSWISLFTDRAVAYRARQGMDARHVAMAVLVQAMVPAEVSGVIFTADPRNGDKSRLYLEAVPGLGEALVSGRARPARWLVARQGLSTLKHEPGEDAQTLDGALIRELLSMALQAEALFDGPQDVEFCVQGSQPLLLQSRPITTLPPPEAPEEGEEPEEDRVWSNVNVGELLPEVATPMTWSYVLRFVRLLFGRFAGWFDVDLEREPFIGRVAGRIYADVGLFTRLLESLPMPGKLEISEVFGGELDKEEVVAALQRQRERAPRRRTSLGRLLLRLPAIAALFLRNLRSARGELELKRHVERNARLFARKLSEEDDQALLAMIGAELAATLDNQEVMAQAAVGMGCTDLLFKLSARWLGDESGALANQLLTSTDKMESAQAALSFWELGRAARADPQLASPLARARDFDALRSQLADSTAGRAWLECWDQAMARHGHHCQAELDVAAPRWSERPDYVLGLVQGYAAGMDRGEPWVRRQERAQRRTQLLQETAERLGPLRRSIFRLVLAKARHGLALRENYKSEAIRVIAHIRRVLLELGRRLEARGHLPVAQDVFFLSAEELPGLLRGADAQLPATLRRRKERDRRWRQLQPPAVVLGRYDPRTEAPAEAPTAQRLLKGLPVSAGVAEGPARVLLRADGPQKLLPGEILVAPYTDPGWTPHFLPAAGLVADMGGLLSHGSVVAREYGLPAVVNVGPATRIIRDGQRIRVDGDRGEVQLLEP